MTTDRQQRANRANAKSSTGPKSAPGKARSAQNALRHGLNVSVLSDPGLTPQVEAIAREIAGPDADGCAMEDARRIAEAQIDLIRVRNARGRLIRELLSNPNFQPLQGVRKRLELMKTIDGIERLRGAPSEKCFTSSLLKATKSSRRR